MREALRSFLERIIKRLDFYMTGEGIRAYTVAAIPRLKQFPLNNAEMCEKIGRIFENMTVLCWVGETELPDFYEIENTTTDKYPDEIFKRDIINGWIISRGTVKAGRWRTLEEILRSGTDEEKDFAKNQMELLLRHVEVRRKNSLKSFEPPLSGKHAWMERHAICAFFSRYARREKDLRFLNASMKMNDWYCRRYKNKRMDLDKVAYILSLTEQERSVKELL